ncbi:MAG: Ig-like domain-containing protein, partial [Planctomycetota bacterium]
MKKTPASRVLHRVVWISLLLIIFSGFSSYTIAGIQEKQDISEMVQRSELVIRGEVISTESQWRENSRGRHIYTNVTVEILDRIKGNIKGSAFAFEVVGGIVGDIREFVSDTPAFEIDEDAIVFLGGEPLTIQGGINGKLLVYDGRVYWDGLEATVDSFIQALKILEQDPGATVSLGEESEAPPAGVTAAECYIDSGYKWPGSSPVVNYVINENTSDCTGEGAAVQRGAETWNNACDVVNFRFNYNGSCSSTGSSQNFVNCITWGTTGGSLATTYGWTSGTEVVECDVVFNDSYTWSTSPSSSQYDIESVAAHEFGHWLVLDDLYDLADECNMMYGYIGDCEVKRELRPCDVDGLCSIYSCAGGCYGVGCRICDECEPEDENLGIIGTTVWGYSKSGNCGNGGKWVGQFTGEAGATYHFDLCPDSPGSGNNSNFDPDIKITNSSCVILDGEDGVCSSPLYSPNNYEWVCSSSGTYYVIIAPYNSYNSHNCTGVWCDTFTLRYYKEGGTCPPPTGVSASDGTYTDKVQITWGSVSSPCNYYRVYRATSSGGTKTPLGTGCQTSTTYDDYNAIPGVTYYYWVKSAKDGSCTDASDFSSYNTGWRMPTPPEAHGDSVTTFVDTPVTIVLQATDDGYPGPLTYIITSLPVYGDLNDPCAGLITDPCTPLDGNEVEYIPDTGYEGQDSFGFKANDGGEDSNEATVSVSVTACIFFDYFPSMILDTNNWDETFGTPTVDACAVNEPSPPYSLHLEETDSVTSRVIDLSGCFSAELHYWWKRVDTESGDDLYVDYWDENEWQSLHVHPGGADANWEPNFVELPTEALHSEFQLRFRVACDSDSDEWYIDDVCIRCQSCIEHPVLDTEPNAASGLCNTIYWDPVAGANDYYAECAN